MTRSISSTVSTIARETARAASVPNRSRSRLTETGKPG